MAEVFFIWPLFGQFCRGYDVEKDINGSELARFLSVFGFPNITFTAIATTVVVVVVVATAINQLLLNR